MHYGTVSTHAAVCRYFVHICLLSKTSMAVMSVNADETTTVNDVYNITFNKGTVSGGSKQPTEACRYDSGNN